MSDHAHSSTAPAAPRAGFGLARAVQDWRARRLTRHELSGLSSHQMRDIGLAPPPADPAAAHLRQARVQW